MPATADCQLLGTFGLLVQAAITLVCAVALVAVWFMEKPRRPLLTWAFDISKQVIGAAYGKCYNIAQAEVFSHMQAGAVGKTDQCVWYLMGIATDCLITTFLCWGANSLSRPWLQRWFHIDIGNYDGEVPVLPTPRSSISMSRQSSLHFATSRQSSNASLLQHGAPEALDGIQQNLLNERSLVWPQECTAVQFSERPSFGSLRPWLLQVLIWLLLITLVRLFVSIGLLLFRGPLYDFYATAFQVLHLECPIAKMTFAVLIFPALGDTFQIVVQDCFLKKAPEECIYSKRPSGHLSPLLEPLESPSQAALSRELACRL